MYKLIIIDDEEAIRQGLCNLVNWKSMGFEVVGAFEDGEDAVNYINNMAVDVVLTDIKMTFMSGLELAKYIHTNKLGIKIVIISGYKEFEFARQALSYNVFHYLLKPTRLDELKNVFMDIKVQLDKEKEQNEKLKAQSIQYNELINTLQEQFFTDLLMGGFRKKEDIEKRLKVIGFDNEPDSISVCILNVQIPNFHNYTDNDWNYGKDSFYDTVCKLTNMHDNPIKFFPIYNAAGNSTKIIAVSPDKTDSTKFQDVVKKHFDDVKLSAKTILGFDMEINIVHTYDSIFDIEAYNSPLKPSNYEKGHDIKSFISTKDYNVLLEQQKLFMSYIDAGNIEMVKNLFDNFIDEIKFMDIKVIHNFIIDLFAKLRTKLEEMMDNVNGNIFDYQSLLSLNDIKEIREWGINLLCVISDNLEKYRDESENRVIQKAKEYVKNNYNKDIGLGDVADYVFLSPIYFSRLFKQQTGQNFIDYLTKVRIRKAMEFLREDEYKVYEISTMVGYKNTKYFYKLFKEYTGFTPAEYRHNALKEGDGGHDK